MRNTRIFLFTFTSFHFFFAACLLLLLLFVGCKSPRATSRSLFVSSASRCFGLGEEIGEKSLDGGCVLCCATTAITVGSNICIANACDNPAMHLCIFIQQTKFRLGMNGKIVRIYAHCTSKQKERKCRQRAAWHHVLHILKHIYGWMDRCMNDAEYSRRKSMASLTKC